MIRIATGVTPNYLPRARDFLRSLEPVSSRSNALGAVFLVADDPPSGVVLPIVEIITLKYSDARLQLPKFMLQNGGFCDFAPEHWKDDDVIIFTDADAVLQRLFTHQEKDLFAGVAENEVMAGRNTPSGRQSLSDEAMALSPTKSAQEIESSFPGCSQMECKNFGFVVARLSAWKKMLELSVSLWPEIQKAFQNAAMVQWMMCYAIQSSGMKFSELPLSIHAHGHLGLPEGIHCDSGIWKFNDEIVAFAHAL